MVDPQHTQWAAMLKKTQHVRVHKAGKSLTLEKKQVSEEITYYKKKLSDIHETGDKTNIEKHAKKLITLRAKLLAIQIKMRKEQGQENPEQDTADMEHYYKDCYTLLHALNLDMPLE